MDALFSSNDAWLSHLAGADENDEMKTPECAEAFVTMLLTITDRYVIKKEDAKLAAFDDGVSYVFIFTVLFERSS